VQKIIEKHEAAGTTTSSEYQVASLAFSQRYICRLDPWPEAMQRSFAGWGHDVYYTMWGPSEFKVNGNLADFERTSRLHEISVPTLFLCGRYDEMTPEAVQWYQSLLPGSELVIFEQSAHLPHLEEGEKYLQAVRDFLRRADSQKNN
jgi:proline iminopeptidase